MPSKILCGLFLFHDHKTFIPQKKFLLCGSISRSMGEGGMCAVVDLLRNGGIGTDCQ